MEVRDAVFCLANNDVSFLSSITSYEKEKIIETIRQGPLKEKILDRCFDSLNKFHPDFLFKIVFDMDEYRKYCIDYLENNPTILNDNRFFVCSFLGKCKWFFEYIKKNISFLKKLDNNIILILLRYAFDTNNKELINLLLLCDDLELRGIAMVELMEMAPYKFIEFYKDLLRAFVKYDNNGKIVEVVDEKYVSRIAFSIADYDLGIDKYEQVKDFILNNYPKNTLAERLDGVNVDGEMGIEFGEHLELLFKDMDELFRTSSNYKFRLFTKYPDRMSDELRAEFYNSIKDFVLIDMTAVEHMFRVGLGDKFIEYSKKYMELSTGAKVVGNAGIGSCTRSFIVGDYVIKCSYKKWLSTRCPDLFLVAKNYEEEIVKSHYGSIIGALEVQKYYHRSLSPKKEILFGKFCDTLRELGYEYDDNVLGLNETPNFFYLDSYKDADCECPEELPDWFKKDPIVLVDRDYVKKVKK